MVALPKAVREAEHVDLLSLGVVFDAASARTERLYLSALAAEHGQHFLRAELTQNIRVVLAGAGAAHQRHRVLILSDRYQDVFESASIFVQNGRRKQLFQFLNAV